MKSINKLLGASLFVSSALAAPHASGQTSRVAQPGDKLRLTAPAHYRVHSPLEGKPHTRHTPSRKSRRSDGAVYAYYDGGWVLPVLVGGQEVALNLDTGSSDLWVASTWLPSDEQAYVKPMFGQLYNPDQSSTYRNFTGYSYGLGYADGSGSSGPAGLDTVDIGGASVPNFAFGVCDSLHLGSGQTSRDTMGPVGLGFGAENSIRPTPQPTFMEALEPYVDQPIFSTYFRPDNTGSVAFGYRDSSLSTGDLTTIAIQNDTYDGQWSTTAVTFGANGQSFNLSPQDMDFDSGTSLTGFSQDAYDAYFHQVSGAGQDENGSWYYPCGTEDQLPSLDFTFSTVTSGPATVSIPGKYIPLIGNPSSGNCYTFLSVSSGLGNAGTPFYISQYMTFNQAAPSLTVAAQVVQN